MPFVANYDAACTNALLNGPSLSPEASAAEPARWPRWLWIATLVLVVVGIAWRTVRYLQCFPIWGDEAFVCLNFLDRDYAGLLQPLRFSQVAPVLFLWSEYAVHQLLGGSELALRSLPFLAGVAAVGLFWRSARIALSPLAGALAVGILAVSYYPVRHSCEAKPYAFDLLAAVVMILLALKWISAPRRLSFSFALTLVLPVALGVSYPAVFVAGAISVALLPVIWRQPGWKVRGAYLLFNAVMIASFAGWYLLAGLNQYSSTHGAQNTQWDMWFAPTDPWALIKWLAAAHTDNMFAYPLGGHNGGSVITTTLCLLGAWQLARSRRWEILLLLLSPFFLTLCAASLHRYPYGGSARVAQHLAPAICLLAGNGAAWCLTWLKPAASRRRCVLAACALLAAIGAAGLFRDFAKPYKSEGDRIARRLAETIAVEAGPEDQVVVIDEDWRLPPGLEWYLRQSGVRVSWNAELDRGLLSSCTRQVWVFSFSLAPERSARRELVEKELTEGPRRFDLTDQAQHRFLFGWEAGKADRCRILHWVHAEKDVEQAGVITAEGDARSSGSRLAPAALDKRP